LWDPILGRTYTVIGRKKTLTISGSSRRSLNIRLTRAGMSFTVANVQFMLPAAVSDEAVVGDHLL
jgi:hypothetical protein